MAFFNFRKQVDSRDASPDRHEAVESVETLRKKALHRLIGSAILVVIGVIVFSLVFDRQPRPIPVDIAIQIPAKEGQPPLVIGAASQAAQATAPETAPSSAVPALASAAAPATSATASASAQPTTPSAAASSATASAAPVAPKASLGPKEELLPAPAKPAPASKPAAVAAPQETKDNVKVAEAQKVKDLLDGKSPSAAASAAVANAERFIVQVGAFADVAKARQARLKVEKAGLKTYTQVAETAEGKRIRVRVGPFASRDEAEKAAKKIKSLDLAANILTL